MTPQELITQDGFFDELVQILHEETGQHINIMGFGGVILSSTRPERIGTIHESAKQIMLGVINEAFVTEEQARQLEGVRAGSNIPIEYNGERIGVIGITGDPVEMKLIVRVAMRTVLLWIHLHEQIAIRAETTQQVYHQLHNMAATIEQLSASSEDFASASKTASQELLTGGTQIKQVSEALKIIKEIADHSNLIGLNAAIEAARAGEAGRGFNVVAAEVRKLATTSHNAVKQINGILSQVNQTFSNISVQAKQNEDKAGEQFLALQELVGYVDQIETMMEALAMGGTE